MKTITFAQAGSVTLGVIILAVFLVPTSFAMKDMLGGNNPSASSSCADKASIFPSSLFTKLNKNHKGTVSGFEIHLSNSEGDCSTMIFSSNAAESSIDLNTSPNSQDVVALR
jgi:hypothetical protein